MLISEPAGAQATPQAVQTADYTGSYADGPNHKVEIVVNADGQLVAVIDDAQYPLKVTAQDELTNGGGGKVPFHRGGDGRVDGYTDSGEFHRKLSAEVSADTLAMVMARARPAGEVYHYRRPKNRHDGIPIGDIAATPLGTDTARAIVAAIADGTYRNVHSVLLYQDGRLVMEEYFYGYDVMRQQQLRSATKSVVAAAAGYAIDHGALSLDTPVVTKLSYTAYDNPDPRKAKITVRDFLTMSSGLDCNDHSATSPGRETVLNERPDWVKATLDLPQINDPGKTGYYCSGGVAVIGRVVENATHSYLPDYADAHLFRPLG
ncbi:MAG: serine hydrolase domain-containing protein, partial [Asticcacaulis sp.]